MPKNLLLADDSITIQKVVGITFANEDYKVTVVDNGQDAVTKARELRPDVILADVVMPRRNGYEVCEAVKNDPALKHIPVLLLAGTFEAFDEARAKQAKADGHIAKPFESGALISKVREIVEGLAPAPALAPRYGAPAPAARPMAPAPGAARPPGPGMPPAGAPRPGGPIPPGARPPGPMAHPPGAGMPPAAPRPGGFVPPGARPPGLMARPPGPGMSPGAPRPGGPLPPGARPPGARPPGPGMPPPGASRPAAPFPSGARPGPGMPPPGARSPAPPPAARPWTPPQPAPARPAPAARRDPFGLGEAPVAPPSAEEDFGDIDMGSNAPAGAGAGHPPAPDEFSFDVETGALAPAAGRGPLEFPEEPGTRPELAPMHAFVPPAEKTGHLPEPARPADGGEAVLREALSKASLEVIERVVWEVVPQLAETIIRENLDRLVKGRQG